MAESRKWKETVAKETEGMTRDETLAYFDRAAVRRRFDATLHRGEQADEAQGEGKRRETGK